MNLEHTYSDNIHDSTIAILGIYPPPLGGVSIHIQRVSDKLIKQNNVVCFFSTEPRYRYKLFPFYLLHLVCWLLYKRPQQVHYHSVYLKNSFLEIMVLIFFKKIMRFTLLFVEHDSRHMYKRSKTFKQWFNWVSFSFDFYILIGDITYTSYKNNGLTIAKKSLVEGAFLPPNIVNENKIVQQYPSELKLFLQEHNPVILINASRLVLLNNKDLYGIDISIELLKTLIIKNNSVGLIIALSEIGNKFYFHKLQKIIIDYRLQNHIFFMLDQKELWPLLKKVNLFVRPSLSDGASVSVQEAAFFKVPIVASDVCARPKRAMLFKTGNKHDFIVQCQLVLSSIANNSCNSK